MRERAFKVALLPLLKSGPSTLSPEPCFRASDLEQLDPVGFSEIARVLLVCPVVPMFVNAKAAASDAVAFRIIESLRRRVIRQGGFAQVVIGISDVGKIGPFRSEKIEADGIDRYGVKRHENAVRPGIVEWRHLPLAMRRTIRKGGVCRSHAVLGGKNPRLQTLARGHTTRNRPPRDCKEESPGR